MSSAYDNPYFHDNVYGHAVKLLREHGRSDGVHLDIGCNLGAVAEPVRDELGRTYVGFDIDTEALEALASRGFETARLDLFDVAAAEQTILSVLADRPVASISILDVLEHVQQPAAVVAMLGRIARTHGAPLVVSVPNIAHRDIGFKLAFGLWDYTATGLMDHTHLHGFNGPELARIMNSAGWHLAESNDVSVNISDQHFPRFHPAVAQGTSINLFLSRLRDDVDNYGAVNQFVGLYLQGHSVGELEYRNADDSTVPFLSIVTRTQGRRLDTLRDVLLCLSAQTCQSFELLVVGHKVEADVARRIERVIDDTHEHMRNKIRFIKVHDGNRTRPLNVGFEHARGQYIAILDDDDIVLGHWVEEFKALATKNPGRVLRSGVVAQKWKPVSPSFGSTSVRATGGMQPDYPSEFDFFQHLIQNYTPPVSMAVPRCGFQDLGIRFDESLTTTEDWDFLMRMVNVCGAASDAEITSIYRQWQTGESSFTVHSSEEWRSNHHAIWRKLDLMPLLLERGSATRIRHLVEDWNRRHGHSQTISSDPQLEAERYATHLRSDILNMLNSTTWRATAPLRWPSTVLGRPFQIPALWEMNTPELEQYRRSIVNSRSWRVVRRLSRMLGR